jgi:two-component system LytT family sensor kinase
MRRYNRQLKERYWQLIRIAGIVILFLLLLGVLSIYFSGNSPLQKQNILRKFYPIVVGITLDWIQNIALLIYISPVLARWKDKRWISFYLPSFCIMGVILALLRHFIIPLHPDVADDRQFRFLVWGFLMNSVILMTIELVLSRYESARISLENAELKMLNLQARHEKLKLQLQPHFLFNSLNALKTLIRKDPVQAEGYLIRLSELLRFSITHNEQNLVLLREELKVSLSYLEMQQTRFQGCLSYTIDIPEEIPAMAKVPAFSLQLLLENAIKHNALTREDPLHIRIRYISPGRILVENNLRPKAIPEAGTGLGLQNLSERYRMLAQEDIQILVRADTFEVYLALIFHEHTGHT